MEILIKGKEFGSRKRGVRVIRVRVTVEIKVISLGSAYPAIPRSAVPKLLGSLPEHVLKHVSHHTYRAVSTCLLQERLLSNQVIVPKTDLDSNLTSCSSFRLNFPEPMLCSTMKNVTETSHCEF